MTDLLKTPLHGLHVELGAKMVPFAGYEMPVSYPLGVMKEHLHTRAKAGLFDVSHMGQAIVRGEPRAAALEALMPQEIAALGEGRQRYGLLLNDQGGIMDDLMFANRGDHLFLVVNAANKSADIAHIRAHLPDGVTLDEVTDRALLALQGPAAETVLAALDPAAADMRFMDVRDLMLNGVTCWVSRSGYTGEDGYEISVPADQAETLARALLDHADVEAIGLGARDSLRLEAGLCLHGNDIDAATSPIEAALPWAIQKSRKAGGAKQGGFPGADVVLGQLADGCARKRVGLAPQTRAPMRPPVALYASADADQPIGQVTSGGFGPTVEAPVAMGYVDAAYAEVGTELFGDVRGKRLPVTVAALPFTPANFKR